MISSEQSNSEEKDKIDTGHQKQDAIVRSEEPETIGALMKPPHLTKLKLSKDIKYKK